MYNFLVVDDSPTIRKMIIAALKPLNASFSEASTGLEAIEKLTMRRHDAVTLDLNMPDMHGLELLQFLRQHSSFKFLPVLIITTRSDQEILDKVIKTGANGYLVKPFQPADLLERVKAMLDQPSPEMQN
jgi:two-component system, chemotaxis family, chemotaxis protein CheY